MADTRSTDLLQSLRVPIQLNYNLTNPKVCGNYLQILKANGLVRQHKFRFPLISVKLAEAHAAGEVHVFRRTVAIFGNNLTIYTRPCTHQSHMKAG